MRITLLSRDGLELVAALDIPRVDDPPKVAIWNERTFILLHAVQAEGVASYAETVSLRLELPAGAGL